MTATICPPDLSSRRLGLTAERTMRASPNTLFRVWTEQFERWFAAPGSVLMKPAVNAPFYFETHFQEQRHPHYGRFLQLERDRLVQMTWFTAATKVETVVTVELEPVDDGTHLRLRHSGFPDAESRDRHRDAWPEVLAQQDERVASAET
jgi:uncharacterized protein YndB with AHSA1/START domain